MWNFVDYIVEYGSRSEPPEIFCALKARPSMEELFSSLSASMSVTPSSGIKDDDEGSFKLSSSSIYGDSSPSPDGEVASVSPLSGEEPQAMGEYEAVSCETQTIPKHSAKRREHSGRPRKGTVIKVATKFIWSGPVLESAYLVGSFSDWQERVPLLRNGEFYSTTLLLAPGLFYFKYIIDGQWTHDSRRKVKTDADNNVNNVVSVGLKPAKFVWKGKEREVGVSGSFCGWKQIISLVPSGEDSKVTVMVPPGEHEYKLIVDGMWMCDPAVDTVTGPDGITNNILTV